MQTQIYESDPFTPKKGRLLVTVDSDYRFQKNDELVLEKDGERIPLRVMDVRIRIKDTTLSREILALRI